MRSGCRPQLLSSSNFLLSYAENHLNNSAKFMMLIGESELPNFKDSIRIVNVVASATLDQRLDLNAVVKGNPGVEYRPKQFPGLVFRIKRPKTATLIFNSGKMVCTGAKSEKEAKRAVKKVVRELKKSGIIIVGKPEIKVVNMVASVDLFGLIDLEGCAYSLRVDEPRVVFLLFSTGKLVCTGATKEEDVYKAVAKLHKNLKEKDLIFYE
jgi:transcription initiation factor TFIID TATA-box-binding protein